MGDTQSNTFYGFAVLTDERGAIKKVLRAHIDFTDKVIPGESLTTVIDEQSARKFFTFLVTLQNEKALHDWDINIIRNGEIEELYFVGGIVDGDSLIVASRSTAEAGKFYKEFLKISNEQTDLQRDLQKKNAQLRKVIEERDQFIGMAAHDLRNPLGGITSMCDILLEGDCGPVTEEQQEYLETIRDTTRHMLVTVTEMLDITRIESGKMELYYSEIDLVALIHHSVSINNPKAARKNITIHFQKPEPPCIIEVDQGKIVQVLDNLVSNAIKYSHGGTNISIGVECSDQRTTVTVQDEGQGIPEDELPKLFTPFAKISVGSTAGEESTGLGLAISKQIVEGHGGTINAKSTPGKGSLFSFTLPLTPPDRQDGA